MAINEWIPLRKNLGGDPAVIRISQKLQVRTETVVGYLHKVWSWLDSNCDDGVIHGVDLEAIEQHLALPNFLKMMVEVGWLEHEEQTLTVPKWDQWFSHSSKKRLKKGTQQRNRRRSQNEATLKPSKGFTCSSSCSSSSSLKKKEIESAKRTELPFETADVRAAWESYIDVRVKRKYVISERAISALVNKLAKCGSESQAVEMVDNAIVGGWKMFYDSRDESKPREIEF